MKNINSSVFVNNETNVYIVDEPMGRGKTSAAINFINETDGRFLVITPYLSEVRKYKTFCKGKNFTEPVDLHGSKLRSLKQLLSKGENIVSTHALFQRFDEEVIALCKLMDYTLIMDEVAQVVEQFDLSKYDEENILRNYVEVDPLTNLLKWKEEFKNYEGKFTEVKNLCDLDSLAVYNENAILWLFPVRAFTAFREVYLLTYMFEAQIQRYYYDYHNIPYSYLHVSGDSLNTYRFTEEEQPQAYDYTKLIHILEHDRMNEIGSRPFSLSHAWYDRAKNTALIKQLKHNTENFFRNVAKSKSSENMWTTFKTFKSQIVGKGYTKGFLELNARATNEYRERTCIAYTVNVFMHPIVKGFFLRHGVEIDEDEYALSEMLQFVWRSAIRDGKEITIYVPSARMRKLLHEWIEKQND